MTLEIFRIAGMLTSNIHIWALGIQMLKKNAHTYHVLALTQFIGIAYPIKYKVIEI